MYSDLSSRDRVRLQHTQLRLASPIDYEDATDWMRACMREVRALHGADIAHFFIPGVGWLSEMDDSAQTSYREYFYRFDVAPLLARRRGLEVGVYERLVGTEAFRASEFYNDWIQPNRLFQSHGMSFALGGSGGSGGSGDDGDDGPTYPYLAVSYATPRPESEIERGVLLFEHLIPAFKTGVRTWLALARHRQQLLALIDSLPQRLTLCDAAGHVLHRNPSLEETLAAEPQRDDVEAAIRQHALSFARSVCGRDPFACDSPAKGRRLRTRRGSYRIGATHYPANAASGTMVLITLEPLFSEPLSSREVFDRFGLTKREIDVARFLVADESNATIARRLGISVHTVKRHVERVLAKLGIRSRAQVRRRLSHDV